MRLFLMRHAAAEAEKEIDDHLRALTAKGVEEANGAAEFLQNYQIDKMLVSSAKRTIQTAEIIQNKIHCKNFEIIPELYGSSAEAIIKIISKQQDLFKTILVIAHNPGILNASLSLMDQDSSEYESLIDNGMTTAKIINLDFSNLSNWQEINFNKSIYI